MTERKFTDEEVIRALECCNDNFQKGCDDCPFDGAYYDDEPSCVDKLNEATRDLINRQMAEIERLKEECDQAWEEHSDIQIKYDLLFDEARALIEKAKAEAIKEFADRVIDLIYEADDVAPLTEWQIRNLVKEMTESKPCTEDADCSTEEGEG